MRIISKLVVLAGVWTGASALADPIIGAPPGWRPPQVPENSWILTLILSTGEVTRFYPFPTKEACEAAIPKYEQEKHGYNGQCEPYKPPPK